MNALDEAITNLDDPEFLIEMLLRKIMQKGWNLSPRCCWRPESRTSVSRTSASKYSRYKSHRLHAVRTCGLCLHMSQLAWSVCLRWLSIPASPAKTEEPTEMPVNKFSVVNITYCVRHWLSMPRKNLTHLARTFSQVSSEAFFFYCNYATLLVNNKK